MTVKSRSAWPNIITRIHNRQMKTMLGLIWFVLPPGYGAVCVFRDISVTRWTPIKTYLVRDHIWWPKIEHIIQVRSYPDGWWRKYEAIIDDWEEVKAGFASPEDAFRGGLVYAQRIDKEVTQ